MRSRIALALGLSMLVTAAVAGAGDIEVMTQNQFLGADLGPLLEAFGTPQQAEVLAATLERMADNDFPLRARALARQICEKQPHVVGLQEVFRFSVDGWSGPPLPLPFVDHLDELMAALAGQCNNYVVAASSLNSSLSAPVPGFGVISFIDRDVTLTRIDVPFAPVSFNLACPYPADSGVPGVPASGCSYSQVVPLPPPFGAILRGYHGVDALVGGQPYRIVNTHLEVQSPDGTPLSLFFQAAQASELIITLGLFPKPPGARTIVVGDLNSSPDDAADPALLFVPPYGQFTGGVDLFGVPISSPYTDAWTKRPGRPPGYTCCHDEDLSIRKAPLDERIDLILTLEPLTRVRAVTVGDEARDRIRGLWPSDHVSVVADLGY